MRFLAAATLLLVTGTAPLAAQHQHATPADSQPYASLASRDIKALAPEEIARYLSGEGMGLALAGELNGFPGPKHVLEFANQLGLSADTRTQVTTVFDAMHSEAVRLGARIVEAERRLDRSFAAGVLDDAALGTATADIARLQGRLRYVHLRAHLAVARLLTPEQVRRYEQLRGYRPEHR